MADPFGIAEGTDVASLFEQVAPQGIPQQLGGASAPAMVDLDNRKRPQAKAFIVPNHDGSFRDKGKSLLRTMAYNIAAGVDEGSLGMAMAEAGSFEPTDPTKDLSYIETGIASVRGGIWSDAMNGGKGGYIIDPKAIDAKAGSKYVNVGGEYIDPETGELAPAAKARAITARSLERQKFYLNKPEIYNRDSVLAAEVRDPKTGDLIGFDESKVVVIADNKSAAEVAKEGLKEQLDSDMKNKDLDQRTVRDAVTRDKDGTFITYDPTKVRTVEEVEEEDATVEATDRLYNKSLANLNSVTELLNNPSLNSAVGGIQGQDNILGFVLRQVGGATGRGSMDEANNAYLVLRQINMEETLERAKAIKPVSDSDMAGLTRVAKFSPDMGEDRMRAQLGGAAFANLWSAYYSNPTAFKKSHGVRPIANTFNPEDGSFMIETAEGKRVKVNGMSLPNYYKKVDVETAVEEDAAQQQPSVTQETSTSTPTGADTFFSQYGL